MKNFVGFSNNGNECYMNSSLQLILNCTNFTTEFDEEFLKFKSPNTSPNDESKEDKKESLIKKETKTNCENEEKENDEIESKIVTKKTEKKLPNAISRSFYSLLRTYNKGVNSIKGDENNSLYMSKNAFFKAFISRYDSIFGWTSQEDAQEFLIFLLDDLHEQYKYTLTRNEYLKRFEIPLLKENESLLNEKIMSSFVYDMFGISSISTVICHECKNVSKTISVNETILSLPIIFNKKKKKRRGFMSFMKNILLECCHAMFPFEYQVFLHGNSSCHMSDMLDHYYNEIQLDSGKSYYFCSKCKCKRSATKIVKLLQLSQYFIVHVKRFDSYVRSGVKISNKLIFPNRLNMRKFFKDSSKRSTKDCTYKLSSIVDHIGTFSFGHFTAYTKSNTDKWYLCNDSSVDRAREKDVMGTQAYILLYERIKK